MKGSTLTIVDSHHNHFDAGTEMVVTRHHVNQFTGRETINAEPVNGDKLGSHLGMCQFIVTDTKDVLKEIVVGRESDTIAVNVE